MISMDGGSFQELLMGMSLEIQQSGLLVISYQYLRASVMEDTLQVKKK